MANLQRLTPIVKDGLNRIEATHKFTNEFIDDGISVNSIRDIWYRVKHKMEDWKPYKDMELSSEELSKRETDWGDKINAFIGDALFERYMSGDTEVYVRTGLRTSSFTTENGSTPIILVSEKKTRELDLASKELGSALLLSSGHVPSFEMTFMAKYLARNIGEGQKGYILAIADYDPAGELIFASLMKKMEAIFYMEAPETAEIVIVNVSYGEHEEIIAKYDNYQLPPSGLKKWQSVGKGERGVELNVIYDIREHIDRTIIEYVDPFILEGLSVARARYSLYQDMLWQSQKYRVAQAHVDEIDNEIRTEAYGFPYSFDSSSEWLVPVRYSMVENMTTINQN